jgi:uncharacterized membrane protein
MLDVTPRMGNNQKKIKQLVWHDIKNVETAKTVRIPALVFSVFGTFLCSVVTFEKILGDKDSYGYLIFLYLAFYAIISFGLFKMSRVASIVYFVFSIVAVILAWGHTTKLIFAVAGVFVALLAIRGIFSYTTLCGVSEQTATSNQRSDHDRA